MKNDTKTAENYYATDKRRRKRNCVGQLVYTVITIRQVFQQTFVIMD